MIGPQYRDYISAFRDVNKRTIQHQEINEIFRAQERSMFLGRNSLGEKIANNLVELNPTRNYEYLKKLGVSQGE